MTHSKYFATFFAHERNSGKKIQSRPEHPKSYQQLFYDFLPSTFYASINVAIIVGWNVEIVLIFHHRKALPDLMLLVVFGAGNGLDRKQLSRPEIELQAD
jgi:hypothetical protein